MFSVGIRRVRMQGKVSKTYTLHGHKDVSATTSPGAALYNVIKTWKNFNENGKLPHKIARQQSCHKVLASPLRHLPFGKPYKTSI